MKAGTTSFHNYLNCHPDIAMSEPKELNYFSNSKYWSKGVKWYEWHFAKKATICGESSTSYTVFPRIVNVPERMSALVPNVKLIYLVRDPVERLVSHYVHFVSAGKEKRTFGDVVKAVRHGDQTRYLFQSLYFSQLEQYLKFFERKQILVLTTEALIQQQENTLKEVCGFLELPYGFSGGDLSKKYNRSSRRCHRTWWGSLVCPRWLQTHPRVPGMLKSPFLRLASLGAKRIERPELSEGEVESLVNVFRPDVRRLKEFTGKEFREWRAY